MDTSFASKHMGNGHLLRHISVFNRHLDRERIGSLWWQWCSNETFSVLITTIFDCPEENDTHNLQFAGVIYHAPAFSNFKACILSLKLAYNAYTSILQLFNYYRSWWDLSYMLNIYYMYYIYPICPKEWWNLVFPSYAIYIN